MSAARRLSLVDHLAISCFWLAYNFHWGALLGIVLPHQIAALVGDAQKELYNGLIPALGAALSLFLTPIAGALSDRSRSSFGRRRPYIAVGTLINVVFLLFLAAVGSTGGIALFVVCYLGVQFGNNWSGGKRARVKPLSTAGKVKWGFFTGATATTTQAVRLGTALYAVSNDRVLHALTLGSTGGTWPSGWKRRNTLPEVCGSRA